MAVYLQGGVEWWWREEELCAAAPATSFGLLRPDLRVEPPTFLGAGMAQPGMGDASLAQVLPPLLLSEPLSVRPVCIGILQCLNLSLQASETKRGTSLYRTLHHAHKGKRKKKEKQTKQQRGREKKIKHSGMVGRGRKRRIAQFLHQKKHASQAQHAGDGERELQLRRGLAVREQQRDPRAQTPVVSRCW